MSVAASDCIEGTGAAGDAELSVGALAFAACRSGALFLESERMLVVADLHLEKGAAFASRGQFLPPYDSRQTLAALAAAVARFRPAVVVALGDSVHAPKRAGELATEDAAGLTALQNGRDWIWVAGNHDPVLSPAFGGVRVAELAVAGVALRHAPGPSRSGPEIAGHLHPAAKVRGPGSTLRRRCFVSDGERCVMPAFGAYAGGLNVLAAPFAPVFPNGFTAHVLGGARIYAVGRERLAAD